MKDKVWVCGLGAISSIGYSVLQNFESLVNGLSGTGKAEILQTIHKDTLPVCEIKKTNDELASLSNMKPTLPRGVYLAAMAAKEAMAEVQSQTEKNIFETERIAFISGNTVGGMDLSEQFFEEFLQEKSNGHLRDVIHHECGSITELTAKHLGLRGYMTTLSTACSSSANAVIQGSKLIKHGKTDIVIAGGTDPLCRFTINGFNTLMILDNKPCTPFDENRKGLNLGEGAAYIVLVSDQIKNKYNLKPIAEISGYANANDAFHQTASSAEGKGNFLAMKEALDMSGLQTSDITYINAHGTGTANNDSSEGIAIERLFEKNIPIVSSTKANTGHTLGACGALEAVYSCLAIRHNTAYPSLRVETDMKEFSFKINRKLITDKQINHVMSNSFGFGGNCTSLIFSKP